jgi:2-methylfumaryl-CoA isomerase
VTVVALTTRQWNSLLEVTGLRDTVGAIEQAIGVELQSVSHRFQARDLLAAVLQPWFEARTLKEIRAAFAGTGVSWGAYQTFSQLVREDPRCSTDTRSGKWSKLGMTSAEIGILERDGVVRCARN